MRNAGASITIGMDCRRGCPGSAIRTILCITKRPKRDDRHNCRPQDKNKAVIQMVLNHRLSDNFNYPGSGIRSGLFAGDDSFAGANFSASAALDAGVGIDYIDVAFRDSFNGAVGQAGAASDAFVGNYVSHCSSFIYDENNVVPVLQSANLYIFRQNPLLFPCKISAGALMVAVVNSRLLPIIFNNLLKLAPLAP